MDEIVEPKSKRGLRRSDLTHRLHRRFELLALGGGLLVFDATQPQLVRTTELRELRFSLLELHCELLGGHLRKAFIS